MAQRPRSHQIEGISVRRFEGALPDAWVSRPISPDYGVDREIEIFTAGGESTGIKFAVQLKATDDGERADRVRLKVSQLNYLLDYDTPCIVVRYDAGADLLRWQWATLIRVRTPLKPSQESVTYRFEAAEIWDENTPSKIESALRARRALANFPTSAAMPVRLDIAESVSASRYSVERAVRAIIEKSRRTLATADLEPVEVELHIRVKEHFLSVDFGMLGSVTFDLDTSDPVRLSSAILYAMAFLFAGKRLLTHARAAGLAILDGNYTAGSEELAARASYALADDAMAQAQLAVLNNLHGPDSVYYPVIVGKLIKAGKRNGGPEAVTRFLAAALKAAAGDHTREAAIHYSTANALRLEQSSRALFHYNRARHLRPSYLKAGYFLGELAGTLFNAKRYACSSNAYSRAIAIAPSDRLQLCYGDALLYSGDLEAAAHRFDLATRSAIAQLAEEAVIKLELCHMLSVDHGPHVPTDWSRQMDDVPQGIDQRSAWIEHLEKINSLDPLAHFNLGVSDVLLGDHASALGHFVACAIVQSGDVEAWSNAIICALQIEQAELAVTLLHLSINKAGLDAYDVLRTNLATHGGVETLLAELDEIAMAADSRPNPTLSERVTLRILDNEDAIVIGEGATE